MKSYVAHVLKAQKGDLQAFDALVREFQNMAIGFACSMLGDYHLAEDAAQEAFIETYRDLANLKEPKAFPAWFRRIVVGRCNRLKRRKAPSTVPLEYAEYIASHTPNPLRLVEAQEVRERVLSAVRSLPCKEREVTELFYMDGYSLAELEEFLGTPLSSVKNRLHSARLKLRERITEMGGTGKRSSKDGVKDQRPVTRVTREEATSRPAPSDNDLEEIEALIVPCAIGLEVGFGLIGLVNHNAGVQMLKNLRSGLTEATDRETKHRIVKQIEVLEQQIKVPVGERLCERIVGIRKMFARDMGLVIPPVEIRDNCFLKPGEYSVFIHGRKVAEGELPIERALMVLSPGALPEGLEGDPAVEPAYRLQAYWIDQDKRGEAEKAGLTIVEHHTVIVTHLVKTLQRHAADLLTRHETASLLEMHARRYPKMMEGMPASLDLNLIQKVLKALLRDGVSIRHLTSILESMAEIVERTHEVEAMVSQVRQGLTGCAADR